MSQIILPKFPNAKKVFAELEPAKKSKRRTKAEWLEKFAAVPKPQATAEESASQRALFERHDAAVITLRLPMAPSVNHYWRHMLIGKRVANLVSSEGRAYKEAVKHCYRGIFLELSGRLRVLITICYGDQRKIDLDNRTKSLLDALTEAKIWGDDSQIDDLRVLRGPVDPSGVGFCDVVIETIGE